ncbi:nucleoside monophosphate kinase [Blochmannia endosymbiont of Colobopsis nipponica]|uniref:adenylate kinase family protein n=1 Tax=Blochmannia endosymbiont of Colobopsis nipponica TaxID=2681987 RepID=UPI00177F77B0|nr:nucleoside monophosphate kinase [Blochmannia endosymbiont of Colobopsis nipponica]QOI11136.1 nucleoside monophosphate kinase [Blochmannia endosymbiont of Colobopsis nipponica]
MRIILLGAPGSGKGTQAKFLTDRYGIPLISMGEILRNIVQKKSDLCLKIKKFINFGRLLPDSLIIDIVENYINYNNYRNKFLLDGVPRTIGQAIAMKNKGILIDIILEFVLSDALIIERTVGRRIHVPSGRIYHTKFKPPKYNDLDDITGEQLVIRKDDEKNIVHKRLREYHKNIVSIIEFYSKRSYMNNALYFKIDANRNINDINLELVNIFSQRLR